VVAPLDVADLLIEYSHDDRVGSVVYSDSRGTIQRGVNATPLRDRPLVLKNITPGKNAPDFLNGLYDRNERNDEESLDELFRETSLWLEIEYESEGRRIISECELPYTRWHEQIRTGQHRVRLDAKAAAKET